MRTIPEKKQENKDVVAESRIKNITRKAAIVFILIVQLAIIYKMLL